MNMPAIPPDEYITGEKFEVMCDVDCEKDPDFKQHIMDHRHSVVTVFCQTHEIKNHVDSFRQCKNKKIVLVTHNSDGAIQHHVSGRWFDYQWKKEANIVHWFCQNCDVDEPNVTPIPIALENSYVFPLETKQGVMAKLREQDIPKQNKMYLCFHVDTNKPERETAWRQFSNLPWTTCVSGFNNAKLVGQYFDNMASHAYILSPDGNGMDCVRTWEALYMGAIPIVKTHVFSDYFAKHLPIIVVRSWDQITLNMLNDNMRAFDRRTFNYDMLKASYWRTEINKVKQSFK